MKDPVRFLHLADLHLMVCDNDDACGPNDPACHPCIKAKILDGLHAHLGDPQTKPDLLLLAGDLTESCATRKEREKATAPLERLVSTALKNGVVVAGVTGEHDGVASTSRLRRGLGWKWLLGSGDVNRETGVAVHGVEGQPKQRGVEAAIRATAPRAGEPAILLAHVDWSKVPRTHASLFQYCAFGHLHWAKFGPLSAGSRTTVGYPGHLFSYWDGCGKAWPVHALEGEIFSDGRVVVKTIPLSGRGATPETRRIYVDASAAGRRRGVVVFENAPNEAFFSELGVEPIFEHDMDPVFHNVYCRVVRVRYDSKEHLRHILRQALVRHAEDVFVTPSPGRDWASRIKDYGRALVGERFERFASETFKRSAGTQ